MMCEKKEWQERTGEENRLIYGTDVGFLNGPRV